FTPWGVNVPESMSTAAPSASTSSSRRASIRSARAGTSTGGTTGRIYGHGGPSRPALERPVVDVRAAHGGDAVPSGHPPAGGGPRARPGTRWWSGPGPSLHKAEQARQNERRRGEPGGGADHRSERA